MGFVIPWWLYFFLGFVLGAITFSKKLRGELSDMMNKNKKKRRQRYYDVEADEEIEDGYPEPKRDDRDYPRRRVYSERSRRGTVIREYHFHDDD